MSEESSPTPAPTHFCHECQHMRTATGRNSCAKRHKIEYKFPEGSMDDSYGFHAPHGCAASFKQRTPDFYKSAEKRGRKALAQQGL